MPADVARALGDLEGTVRSLQVQWARQEDAATAGRRLLHEKFESLSSQVQRLDGRMGDVQQDVAEIKKDVEETVMPAIDAYALDKAKKDGAVGMGKWIWAIVLPVCTLVGFAIHEALLFLRAGGISHIPGLH